MKKLHISSVRPGDVVARTIFQENGNVLLGIGMELNERYIDRLARLGIDTIYVEDKHTMDLVPDDVISDETRKRALDTVHSTMTGLIDQPKLSHRTSNPQLGKTFRNVFGSIIQELIGKKDLMINLANLHTLDGYLFHHSVNVAILSAIMGLAKGYNQNQLYELGIGALLFDVGMTTVPKEVLAKKGSLTAAETALVESHTIAGFNILRAQHDISLLSAHCALQHHERYDGKGYNRQLKQNDIHEYAQIVGLADMYDALTSTRSHRQRYTPSEASEFLFAAGNQLFDIQLLRLFFRHIALYPIASTVVLNTGQIGVVSAIHVESPHRPVIRILYEKEGVAAASPYEIDLNSHLSLVIVRTM